LRSVQSVSKPFTIYRSSAGSGKTRTLAKAYLTFALQFRAGYFKHILAVTFTNKATQEMKDRILGYLDEFANGRDSELAAELRSELNLDDSTFQQYAKEAQSAILHQYSQFSISTIDAFFQKVIRSFTREAGLVGDYRLEVEQDAVLEEVIDNLIDELGSDKELTDWVVDFARENLENERAWDVRHSLIAFAGEIFREEFKAIEEDLIGHTRGPEFFPNLLRELRKHKYEFVHTVKRMAVEAMQQFQALGVQASDFKYGGGVYNFFQKFARISRVKDFDEDGKGKRVEKEYQDSKNWPSKDTPHAGAIVSVAEGKLIPLLNEMLVYRHRHYETALSAEVALNNFYAFGLLADISRKLKEYKDENNLMLLADAPKFLNGVIQDSDTPFIYEKVGSFFNNYLIDEFQDTSGLQWKNFLPLLTNSLDQGYPSLIVGDVKQAIYRWRGGDLQLLQQGVEHSIGKGRIAVHELNSNYRSLAAVVDFNNALFRSASVEVAAETGQALPQEAYADVAQRVSKAHEGFVKLQFLIDEPEGGLKWKEQALDQIPRYLEELQGMGIPMKDIALLVRRNDEGQQIIAHLIKYRNSDMARPGYSYDVVSNESLRLDGAASINLLLGALRYLFNPDDDIARAQLAYEYSRMNTPDRILTDVFSVTNQKDFEEALPATFTGTKEKAMLKKLPLFELTETIIMIFKLGEQHGELAYLQAFQDLVLEFGGRERNDLGAFLEWWEDNKHKKSIQASGNVNAAQIMTIHKSKGLQFRYVILPFCAWNLDHDATRSPNLWVRSDNAPFDAAGYLPVKYSSTLEDTIFASFYSEERTRSYLDNLNLLYVGLTRAEQGMIIMAPHPTESRNAKRTVAQTMYSAIQRSDELRQHWNVTGQTWSRGTWEAGPAPGKPAENLEAVGLTVYPASPWREKLVIRQTGAAYFDADSAREARPHLAIHLYNVLSRAQDVDDVDTVLDRLVMDGLLTRDERQPIREEVNLLLANPQIGHWFAPSWDVRMEVPVLLPNTVMERQVDRLLLKDRKAIVINFHTDDPGKYDTRQLMDYVDALHKMNYIEVEGYLLYLKTGEVVNVSPMRQRVVKKKDDNQLALEI